MDLRQIDALVAEHVMGLDVKFAPRGKDCGPVVYTGDRDWLQPGTPYYDAEDGQAWELPRYSSDIAAAWQVVERLRRNHFAIRIETNRFPGLPLVTIWSNDTHPAGGFTLQGSAGDATRPEEAPLAICLAALRAVGVEVPTER